MDAGDAPNREQPDQRYVYGSYVDEVIFKEGGYTDSDSDGLLFYHRNQQYSIVALTDVDGEVVERYAYTAYGETTILDANGNEIDETKYANPYTYTGRRADEELGLLYFRARYYDPQTGEFISRDPLEYVDGMSQYRAYFVPGATDPFGLQFREVARAKYLVFNDRFLPIVFVLKAKANTTDIVFKVNAKRDIHNGRGGAENYRSVWNRRMYAALISRNVGIGERGISSEESDNLKKPNTMKGWYFPNFAFMLDGSDGANAYGGDYTVGGGMPTVDADGNAALTEGKYYVDDDFMVVDLSLENDCGKDSTIDWHSLGATGMRDVVHSAGSDEIGAYNLCSSLCRSGSGTVTGTYEGREYFQFKFEYNLNSDDPWIGGEAVDR